MTAISAQPQRNAINTNKLKPFAQKARNLLMEGVARKVLYWGFDQKGNVLEEPVQVGGGYIFRGEAYDDATILPRWKALRIAIQRKGVKEVVEEAAYTWFNRMLAIQILGKNGYDLPQLEYAEGAELLPLILQRARRGQYGYLEATEQQRLQRIITDYGKETEAFGLLLVGYCHQHRLLNAVFGGLNDFTELLLPDNILEQNGFLHLLNTTDAIGEEDYRQVELIGWMYQFYISQRKDEVFAGFKKNKKAEAADIPAATQIFTPNWIVKYMVQNTVGKLWLDLHPNSPLKEEMKYLVEAPEQPYGDAIISEVAQLKLLDPAVGSGHILAEGFDLLYAMYLEEYYTPEEAVASILQHNLFGLDIDKRAAQMAQFAVLLKAARYHRDILKSGIQPQIHAMPEPAPFSRQEVLDYLGAEGKAYEDSLTKALQLMQEAKNLGSIMQFELKPEPQQFIVDRLKELEAKSFRSLDEEALLYKFTPFINVLKILTQSYEALSANPPYMGQGALNAKLKSYVNSKYLLSKADLFSVFMEVCLNLGKVESLIAMINQQSWMFLSSFEELREEIINKHGIFSMLHLGPRTFEELSGDIVQSTAFVLQKGKILPQGVYFRLVKFRNNLEKESKFLNKGDISFSKSQFDFLKIPGSPIAYWLSFKIIDAFQSNKLENYFAPKNGMSVSSSFVRFWFEPSKLNVGFDVCSKNENVYSGKKWFKLSKGGAYRKWFGNLIHVINYGNDGEELKKYVVNNPSDPDTKHWSRRLYNTEFHYNKAITWSKISSSGISFRDVECGCVYGDAGPIVPADDKELLGFLNSKVVANILPVLNPTLNLYTGNVGALPYIKLNNIDIANLVNSNIIITKNDWDSREISWDFLRMPLINFSGSLSKAYFRWELEATNIFLSIHANEEILNSIFINAYDLKEELSNLVLLEDITVFQAEINFSLLKHLNSVFRTKGKDAIKLPFKPEVVIKQFLSYSIGCFMGRYRLDKSGLQIAHPNPTPEETSPYTITSPLHGCSNQVTFEIDPDGILPLMGRDCQFPDDAYHRTLQFISYVWGEDTLTQNINFLQECLNQDLEQYLVRNFWKDHVRTYSKKPIYWLFASPTDAFQVLVYMHRMNGFTVEKIRSNYLLPHLRFLQHQVEQLERQEAGLSRQEARQLDQLRKDLYECEQYDLLLKDKADQQISFDLDDGVTANYQLFAGVVAPIK